MALALIHHLAIGNNVPLDRIVEFFCILAGTLIVEWVPKEDSRVQQLLASREDIFPDYSREGFEEVFGKCFEIDAAQEIGDTGRTLFFMRGLS